MKLIRNSSEGSKTSWRKTTLNLTPGMPVWVQHRQNTSWEPATVVSQMQFQLILDHAREWH